MKDDDLLNKVLIELGREPLTIPELARALNQEAYVIKNRLNNLVETGRVSNAGDAKVQYYFIKGKDYLELNPVTQGTCPTIYAKELLRVLKNGPVWLPLLKHKKYRSLWKAAETLTESGVLERIEYFVSDYETRSRKPTSNTKTQTLLYALPGYNASQLETAILEVEKSRTKGMSIALELLKNTSTFTPEQLSDAVKISRMGTDRIAGHLLEMELIDKYPVCNNRIIYARKGTPELEVMEAAAINYLKQAKELIKASRSNPFLTSDVIKLFADYNSPEVNCDSVCRRLEDRYGVLEHKGIYIIGIGKRNLYYRPGTSEHVIKDYIRKLNAKEMSPDELVSNKLSIKKPFTLSEAARELRLPKRAVSYALKNFRSEYTIQHSPVYFIIPNGTSLDEIKIYAQSLSNQSRIQDTINDYVNKHEAFTLNDLLEEYSEKQAITILNQLIAKGELTKTEWTIEPVYASRALNYAGVIRKITENKLEFSKESKIQAYYIFHSRNRNELSAQFSEPIERINELIPPDYDNQKIYLLNTSGYPNIRSQIELRLRYSNELKISRYDSMIRPYSGSYLIISAPVNYNVSKTIANIPGARHSIIIDDESLFKTLDFNELITKKYDLVLRIMETLRN